MFSTWFLKRWVLLSLISGSVCGQLCKGSWKDSDSEWGLEEASSPAGAIDEASQWASIPKTGMERKRGTAAASVNCCELEPGLCRELWGYGTSFCVCYPMLVSGHASHSSGIQKWAEKPSKGFSCEGVPKSKPGASLCLSWSAISLWLWVPPRGGFLTALLFTCILVYCWEHFPGISKPDAVHEDPEHSGTGAHYVLLVPSSAEFHGM